MMTSFHNRLLGGAALLAAGLAFGPGAAQATPYAFASNNISDFTISTTSGSATVTGGQDTTFNSALFGNGPGSTQQAITSTTGLSDALEATSGVGPFPGQNVFTQALNNGTAMGTRADSIAQGAAINSGAGSAQTVAEGRGDSLGNSNANDKAGLNLTVSVANGTALNFSLDDVVLLEASTANLASEFASSSIQNIVQIRDANGNIVFQYTPGGSTNGSIIGNGTDNADPFNLQASATSSQNVPQDALFQDSGVFSATTGDLAGGSYTISLTTNAAESISPGTPVPEPASMALLGAGLLGLTFARRRRSA